MALSAVYKVEPGSLVVINADLGGDENERYFVDALAQVVPHDQYLILFVSPDGDAKVFGQEDVREALTMVLESAT